MTSRGDSTIYRDGLTTKRTTIAVADGVAGAAEGDDANGDGDVAATLHLYGVNC